MARFTNIGMPRKTFVASAAEEAERKPAKEEAEASEVSTDKGGKRKGWGRDPEIAKRAKMISDRGDDRRLQRIEQRVATTTCFACRGLGHAARDCPNILRAASGEAGSAALLEAGDMAARREEALKGDDGEEDGKKSKKSKGKGKERKGGEITGGKCYRCNSSAHSLSRCPKRADPKDPTPYATCFVCLGQGHLSAACPQNPRGVYVNGGECKVCKSVAHRAKDCPEEARRMREERIDSRPLPPTQIGKGDKAGADEDDFMVSTRDFQGNRKRHEPAKNGQRGPAKMPGEEGAFVPEQPEQPKAAPKPKKKKVVSF